MRVVPIRQPALAAAVLLMVAGVACTGDDSAAPLRVHLVVTATPDPLQGAQRLRLLVTGEDLDPVAEETDRPAARLNVPSVPLGRARVVIVEGLDESGNAVAMGRSSPFELTHDSPEEVTVLLAPLERFATLTAKLEQPRYAHSATALPDGRVVIAGGWDEKDNPLASVEVYDPDTATFVAAPPLAQPRAEHRAVLVGARIVLIGGYKVEPSSGGVQKEPTPNVEIYDVEGGTVGELTMSQPRVGHSASPLADGTVLVVGGDDGDTLLRTTEIIDPTSSAIGPGSGIPAGRMDHTAVALADGQVLLLGGDGPRTTIIDPERVPTADARLYRPEDGGSWQQLTPLPDPRSRAEATVLPDGRALVAGGLGKAGTPATTALLFRGFRFFVVAGPELPPLHEHAIAPLTSGALVAGGAETDQAWLFADNAFRAAGTLVHKRRAYTLTPLQSGAALAVGGHDGETALDDAEIFVSP